MESQSREGAALMAERQAQSKTLRETADELNCLNIRTPQGCQWYASTVRKQIKAQP